MRAEPPPVALCCPRCAHTDIAVCPASTHEWLCHTCWHPFSGTPSLAHRDAKVLHLAAEVLERRSATLTRPGDLAALLRDEAEAIARPALSLQQAGAA